MVVAHSVAAVVVAAADVYYYVKLQTETEKPATIGRAICLGLGGIPRVLFQIRLVQSL